MADSRIEIPEDLVIRLERTMCPSACPDYSLVVHGGGKMVYEGRHYVAAKGKRERHILTSQAKKLEFYRIRYFSLKDRYDPVASDGAVTKTSIRADSKAKEVVNCPPLQAPEDLYNLE